MVTNAIINTNKTKDAAIAENNASDPVFDSPNLDTNTNAKTADNNSAASTTHTIKSSSSVSGSNSNSNKNDNNITTTSNGNTNNKTSDSLNKVNDDDDINNDSDVDNNEVIEKGKSEIVYKNCSNAYDVAAIAHDVSPNKMKLIAKPSPPPQVIIIPATTITNPPSNVATNAAKKIRRAFSMPRNPFRWTHKVKTSADSTQNTNCTTAEHKTGKAQDSGGVTKGGGGSGMNFSAISKSYTLSSCVGGKRERAESIVSLNSTNDSNENGNGTYVNTNNTYSASNESIKKRGAQIQSSMVPPSRKQQQEREEEKQESKDLPKSSNKKFTTKSNTIHGVSNLSSNVSSAKLPNGGGGGTSLSSTMPAGSINNNNSNNNNNNRIFRRSSFRKFLNRIAQHVTASSAISEKTNLIDIVPFYTGCWRRKKTNKQNATTITSSTTATGATATTTADRVPPISGYQWPNDQTPGVMGLKNHGNTCFMNAVLQCLSHTDILAEYFVLDQYKADLKRRNKINSRKFGTKGELTEQLANVLKALWTCKNESDHSTSFKAVVDRYGSQFRSSTQHDAQEFLFWLLDKVHEDLNTATKRRYKSVKNNYGRPDEVIAAETLANHIRCNNSFVQAVFQAQFRSSLTCPRCKKQSNTFDPFHCISVQLPQLTQQTIFVTVVYLTQQPRQVRMGLTVTAGSPIMALREQLHKDTGIPNEQMVLVDLQREGFMRVFYDTQPVNSLQGIETIYCIEVPIEKDAKKDAQTNVNSPQSADLLVLVANVKKTKVEDKCSLERFGAPFCMQIPRDCSYSELQKKLLKEMSVLLKPEVFSYNTPLSEMFQIRLQDPSADPDTFIEQVEHPLLTEMIDLALSVLSTEAGPTHIKLLLEWPEPEKHFCDLSDHVVEHESVPRLLANKSNDTAALTLEQCLEHYTKAETLSAEDAWRCPHCQEYLPVVKTLGLWSLPDILVVHFKRFRQHHGKGANAAKLTTMVKFPLHSFDMSPHLARGVNEINSTAANNNTLNATAGGLSFNRPSPWRKSKPGDSRSSTLSSRENRETRYDLYAVCYHQGDTLETGHYTAACKNPYDRQWYKFDDQRVTKVCSDALPDEIVNNEAYMLFYQRRTSENVECSGSSSNSSDHWISRIAPAQVTAATNSITAIQTNNVEKVLKSDLVATDEEPTASECLEPEVKKTDSKEIQKILPENDIITELKIAQPAMEQSSSIPPTNSTTTTTNAQINTVESNLDALEKLLDYADADIDVINEESADLEKLENLEVKENKKYSKPEESTLKVDSNPEEQPTDCVDNEVEIRASKLVSLSNGFAKNEVTNSIPIANGHASNKICRLLTPSSSASSSLSSLSSQSHEPSSLAVSQNAATNLQNKFNGFLQSHSVEAAATTPSSEKEHLLSSSLKSNSSSIIGSALAGHLSTCRQTPWHGSRSSVSAVEPLSASGAQQSSLHLRHSFSTASNYRLRECGETLSSVLRNSVNTCSKDTLIFLDQQQHHHHHGTHHHGLMEDDDDSTFMGSRSLWISPVTPHKLITVSPKN